MNTSQNITLSVEGMSCASCVGRVEKALQKIPGVISATVYLVAEQANITVAPDIRISSLVQAVQKTGYDAKIVEKSFVEDFII